MHLRRLQVLLPGLLGWFTTLGCGGESSNPGIKNFETWFDGNALDPAKTAVPTTLYAGNERGLVTYAVDESSLFVSFSDGSAGNTISLSAQGLRQDRRREQDDRRLLPGAHGRARRVIRGLRCDHTDTSAK
jgi:hypothetical protein